MAYINLKDAMDKLGLSEVELREKVKDAGVQVFKSTDENGEKAICFDEEDIPKLSVQNISLDDDNDVVESAPSLQKVVKEKNIVAEGDEELLDLDDDMSLDLGDDEDSDEMDLDLDDSDDSDDIDLDLGEEELDIEIDDDDNDMTLDLDDAEETSLEDDEDGDMTLDLGPEDDLDSDAGDDMTIDLDADDDFGEDDVTIDLESEDDSESDLDLDLGDDLDLDDDDLETKAEDLSDEIMGDIEGDNSSNSTDTLSLSMDDDLLFEDDSEDTLSIDDEVGSDETLSFDMSDDITLPEESFSLEGEEALGLAEALDDDEDEDNDDEEDQGAARGPVTKIVDEPKMSIVWPIVAFICVAVIIFNGVVSVGLIHGQLMEYSVVEKHSFYQGVVEFVENNFAQIKK